MGARRCRQARACQALTPAGLRPGSRAAINGLGAGPIGSSAQAHTQAHTQAQAPAK